MLDASYCLASAAFRQHPNNLVLAAPVGGDMKKSRYSVCQKLHLAPDSETVYQRLPKKGSRCIVEASQMNMIPLPENHKPHTDKYFLRTAEILKKENINPMVSMKVFTRGQGPVAGLQDAVAVFAKYASLDDCGGELWITSKENYTDKEPLMIIKGPAQAIVELETMYLGILSHHLSLALGIAPPDPAKIRQKMERLKAIYQEVPIIYFGARHYHWSLDAAIAAAALAGGAVQTSTDVGSTSIRQEGVGTMPHFLILVVASIYGLEQATLKSAELFDKHIPASVPRVTLVDTFNRELTDALAVARYFNQRKNSLRVDTCGENIGEGGTPCQGQRAADHDFQTGTGVTVELVANLRRRLIESGYGDSTEIFLSSGFGDERKARFFMAAHRAFLKETGHGLFAGVGVGEVSAACFCTADIFEVDGRPLAKTGREVGHLDYSRLRRVI